MRLHVCGVRGSTPACGADFTGIGGHTSCVAIAAPGAEVSLVIDAGTGITRVTDLLGRAPFRGTIVLSHLHWDHTCGLPFFAAADRPDADVELLLPDQGVPAEELLRRLMSPPLFPIEPGQLRGAWTFASYGEGTRRIGPLEVLAREIPHKGGRTMGLRVTDGDTAFAYLSDHSPQSVGPGPCGVGEYHEAALELCAGVDLVIHDAQYTAAELVSRPHWGHAAAEYVAGLCEASGARRALLFHHDPGRTDAEVRSIAASTGVDAAYEGLTVEL